MGFFDFLKRSDDGSLPAAITAQRAVQLVSEGATLVDVREKAEWKAGHARAAIHIPLGALQNSTSRIPKGRPVVVVCASGARSRQGAGMLRKMGIEATSLSGGMRAWEGAGGSMS